MRQNELYRLTDLQPEIVAKLEQAAGEVDLSRVEEHLLGMMDIEAAPRAYECLKSLFQEDTDNILMLYCQLECACRIHDRYREKQIDDSIYIDTMKCFPRFIGECLKKNGRMFFDRGWWTYRQTSMKLFRIGSLEYEFQSMGQERVIAVHIPSDADLSCPAVDRSFEDAAAFFRSRYPDFTYRRYTCDSWLMAPALRALLPQDSNIISFQNHFTVTRENREDLGYLEWLFQSPGNTDFKSLPESTSLQKRAKESLLNGGFIGAAHGEILLSEEAGT